MRAVTQPAQPHRDISIIVLTHNRCQLLQQCFENVLMRTSERTAEIIIWNNASRDETTAYLDGLLDERLQVVHHPENIGVNAYARALRSAKGSYLIQVDDDVIDAPSSWDATLVEAFERIPQIGYLATNLEHNPHDITSGVMYGINAHLYRTEEVNGVRLKVGGPVGGWCSVTSREIHDRAGGWVEHTEAFWQEEASFIERVGAMGYRWACLEDLRVVHASGPYYSETPPEKLAYWRAYNRAVGRKETVKRILLRMPPVRALNERHGWFQPPGERPDYVRLYSDP